MALTTFICGLMAAIAIMHSVTGYGSGAPAAACVSLMPGHSVDAQTSDSPYNLTIVGSQTTYSAGETIQVRVDGADFEGILIQARKADGLSTTPLGVFASPPDNTHRITCTAADDSLTHSNTEAKEGYIFTWTAPSSDVGDIEFVATVAQEKKTFWMNLHSSNMTYSAAATTMAPSGSGTTMAPAMFTPLFLSTVAVVYFGGRS